MQRRRAACARSIREVGPRDGFQNEPEVIPTARKVELIDALARTGLRRLEATSFVRAGRDPAARRRRRRCWPRIDVPPEVSVSVLIPNERGLDAALALRDGGRRSAGVRRGQRVPVRVGDPQPQERQPLDRRVARRTGGRARLAREPRACAARASSRRPSAAPTRATCRPSACSRSPRACATRAPRRSASATRPAWPTRARCASSSTRPREALGEDVELTAHFHNTRGQGLANVLAALEAGVESFESSFGELGGCPVPAGATGNIATEDLVSMLHEMGIATGVDLPALLACARRVQEILGAPAGQPHAARRARRLAYIAGDGRLRELRRDGGSVSEAQLVTASCSCCSAPALSRAAATQYSCTETSISRSARARGARRRRSRAWRGRPPRASWRAVRPRAPAWPARAPRGRPRG